MHVILVYDTATERNAAVLRTCRQYLHHTQRSVFEGQLTHAQLTRLQTTLTYTIDPTHDHVTVYTFPTTITPHRHNWGKPHEGPTNIL
ncbi:CRISPR-associated endonuclease Cas2 [Amycolatopsis anabasis]|uniref:CRISPR-associated endonuclease Cas2 n=1 Tax=Amycolatopsis anabasis TaxID=1840409 RepID=UPI00131EBDAA|nr:CRISPR-associated endonuclease Cas2 [Amycolatopsis anabasis]